MRRSALRAASAGVERREPQRGQGQEGLEPRPAPHRHRLVDQQRHCWSTGNPPVQRPGAVPYRASTSCGNRVVSSRSGHGPPPPRRYGTYGARRTDRSGRRVGNSPVPTRWTRIRPGDRGAPGPPAALATAAGGGPGGQAHHEGAILGFAAVLGRHTSPRSAASKALRRRDEGSGASFAGETLRESEAVIRRGGWRLRILAARISGHQGQVSCCAWPRASGRRGRGESAQASRRMACWEVMGIRRTRYPDPLGQPAGSGVSRWSA